MRTRSIIVSALLLLNAAAPLAAQCDLHTAWSGVTRTTALAAAVAGDDLWVSTSYGVTLFDRTTTPPSPVASLAVDGITAGIAATSSHLYAASGSRIVVIAKGKALQQVGSVEVGSAVHDLHLAAPYLYAATGSGLVQLDLFVPAAPVVAQRLQTSAGSALSIARLDSSLYVADGDGSVDVFSIQVPSLPQRVGSFDALARTTAVHGSGSLLLVSDGVQSIVVSASGASATPLATLPWGASSFFASSGISFMAGASRVLRGVDLSNLSSPAIVFEQELPATAGTVNRIESLTGAPGMLFAAAGDLGLAAFDLSGFAAPYPLRSYAFGPASSIVAASGRAWSGSSSPGLKQVAHASDGVMSIAGEWEKARSWVVHDAGDEVLLASSGGQLTLWRLSGGTPAIAASATIPSGARSAVIVGSSALVALDDRAVARVDFSTTPPSVSIVPSLTATALARHGSAVVSVDINSDGNSTLRYFPAGDPAAPAASATIEGAATSGVALGAAGIAAAATFRGLITVDFGNGGAVRVLAAGSFLVRDIAIDSGRLLALGADRLEVRDLSTGSVARTLRLPTPDARALDVDEASGRAVVAGPHGVISVAVDGSTRQPELVSLPPANAYYRKAVAGDRRLYLFDGSVVDSWFVSDAIPRAEQRLRPQETIVDVAANRDLFFTLSAAGKITAYDSAGRAAASTTISEGNDSTPLALHAAGGALYASVLQGCLSGGCEKKTIVLDTTSGLVPTSSFGGGVVAAAANATDAWIVTDMPAEIRRLDIRNPSQPALLASVASEGEPVSLAWSPSGSTLLVLGSRLLVYDAASLTKRSELLDPWVSDPAGHLSYLSQRVYAGDGCAIIAGREMDAIILSVSPSGLPSLAARLGMPSAVRSVASIDSSLFLLTEHSLEIWTSDDPPKRKRGARR